MFRKILVPTDGSVLSVEAAHVAIGLAKACSSRLVVFSVAEPHHFSPVEPGGIAPDALEFDEISRKAALEKVHKISSLAATAGLVCDSYVAQSFQISDEIINAARRYECDAICMATHARGKIEGLFVGSQTLKVLQRSPIPVVVVPPGIGP